MSKKNIILILRISCCCLLLGRAWQHLFWDAPFRTFLWDENLLQPLVEGIFGTPWNEYVTNPRTDIAIQNTIRLNGIFYLFMAVFVWFIRPSMKRLGTVLLWVTSVMLVILAFLYCKEKFFHTGQFFEYASQFAAPLFLYAVLFKKVTVQRLSFVIKIAIALTFICHGLYAYGYYPRPGNYVDMMPRISFYKSWVSSISLR